MRLIMPLGAAGQWWGVVPSDEGTTETLSTLNVLPEGGGELVNPALTGIFTSSAGAPKKPRLS